MELNKYEKARMLGSRALQISMGAPLHVKLSEKDLEEIGYNPVEIAKKELEAGTIPLEIRREMKVKVEARKEAEAKEEKEEKEESKEE